MCPCKTLLGRKSKWLHSIMSMCAVLTARVVIQVTERFNVKRFLWWDFLDFGGRLPALIGQKSCLEPERPLKTSIAPTQPEEVVLTPGSASDKPAPS